MSAPAAGQCVVKPGSVGLPADTDGEPVARPVETVSPHACHAVLAKGRAGWTVAQARVPYDHGRAIVEAKRRGRADRVHFLATGRGTA